MARKLEYEIYSAGDRKMGHVWLGEDNTVDGDNKRVLKLLARKHNPKVRFSNGKKFLENISSLLRSGYIHAKRVQA